MLSFYLVGFKKLLSIGKKIFLVLVVYFVVISLFFHFIAQDKPKLTYDPVKKNREEIYKTINDPQLNKTQEGKLTIAIYRSMLCGMMGEACTDNPADGDKNFSHSLFGFMSNLIVLPYVNPPASGVYWAYSGLQNAGFVPKTYAAEGFGFAAIKPLMNIWKVFRDISYMLLVLVLIAIGFMIMFRAKINPQTVISVENSLPKIVIALLLITFSFPIAGFLIDLMYVAIIIIIAILGDQGNLYNISEFQNKYLNANFGTMISGLLPGGFFPALWNLSNSIIALLPLIINQTLRIILGGVFLYLLFPKFSPIATQIANKIGDLGGSVPIAHSIMSGLEILVKIALVILLLSAIFGLGYAILTPVIFILVFFTFLLMIFRIFFLLFSTYIRIFLMIIFSPLFMLFEAIPGRNAFGFWFKNLFIDILTFPLVITFFVISYLIAHSIPNQGNIWQPPFLTELNPEAFTVLTAMGILFMIPELVKLVKQLVGFKDMPTGLGIGTFFAGVGAGFGGAQAGLGMVSSLTQLPIIGSRILDAKGGIAGWLKDKGFIQRPLTDQVAKYLADEELRKKASGG